MTLCGGGMDIFWNHTIARLEISIFSDLLLLTYFPCAESQRGMEIAFKMLDKDGNGRLCKDEFFVVSPSLINLYC